MNTEKKGRGRPVTRSSEAMMLAVWTLVQEEIYIRGARSIREACERLYYKRADAVIKFTRSNGYVEDVIAGVHGGETLRQRFQHAERARHDAQKYPHLHQRSAYLLSQLCRR